MHSNREAPMAWIRIPGVTGKIYAPEEAAGQLPKKHPCSTCHRCQWCDENRCRVCRSGRAEDEIEGKQGCGCRQPPPSNHKFQAPNSR